MKLLYGVVCLTLAIAAPEREFTIDAPDVYDYHRRFGIPRATELQKEETGNVEGSQRIVGGDLTDISLVPYQAGLVIVLITGQTSVCGASLISQTRLVTAAHCQHDGVFTANYMTIVLGSNTLFWGGFRLTTSDVTMHPNWNPSRAYSDIAVIRTIAIPLSNVIQPIALPDNHINNDFVGFDGLASGYGLTSNDDTITNDQRLSSVSMLIISNLECFAIYGSVVQPNNICTTGAFCRGACAGDSGGPLVVTFNGVRYMVGVTSFGSQHCGDAMPTAYARVTEFISWIRSI